MKKYPPIAVTETNEMITMIAIVFVFSRFDEAIIETLLFTERVPVDVFNVSPFAVAQADNLDIALTKLVFNSERTFALYELAIKALKCVFAAE